MLEKDIAATPSRPTSGFPFFRAVVALFRPFSPLNLQTSPESPAKPPIFSRNLHSFALSAACAACHGLSLLSPVPENSESLALFYRSNRSVGRRPRESRRRFSPSSIPPTRTTQPTPSSPRGSQISGVLFSLQWITRGPFRGTRCESKGPHTVPIVSASATTPPPTTANHITIAIRLPPAHLSKSRLFFGLSVLVRGVVRGGHEAPMGFGDA
ncbi:hypothetical protein Landi51_10756 [Colletotrichum acutatum]